MKAYNLPSRSLGLSRYLFIGLLVSCISSLYVSRICIIFNRFTLFETFSFLFITVLVVV